MRADNAVIQFIINDKVDKALKILEKDNTLITVKDNQGNSLLMLTIIALSKLKSSNDFLQGSIDENTDKYRLYIQMIIFLIKKNPQIAAVQNAKGDTCLHIAMKKMQDASKKELSSLPNIITLLLEETKKYKDFDCLVNTRNKQDKSPLLYADNFSIAEMLVDYGADVKKEKRSHTFNFFCTSVSSTAYPKLFTTEQWKELEARQLQKESSTKPSCGNKYAKFSGSLEEANSYDYESFPHSYIKMTKGLVFEAQHPDDMMVKMTTTLLYDYINKGRLPTFYSQMRHHKKAVKTALDKFENSQHKTHDNLLEILKQELINSKPKKFNQNGSLATRLKFTILSRGPAKNYLSEIAHVIEQQPKPGKKRFRFNIIN